MKLDDYPSISEDQWFAKIKKELKIEILEDIDKKHGFVINPLLREEIDNAVISRTNNQWKFGLAMTLEDPKSFNNKLKKLLGWGMTAVQAYISSTSLDLEQAFDGIFLEMIYPIFVVNNHESLIAVEALLNNQTHGRYGIISDQNATPAASDKLSIVDIDNRILASIGKIRSLRKAPYNPDIQCIITNIEAKKEDYHPLIELTCQSIACVSGGTDVIIMHGLVEDVNLTRLAINIQHMLQMESSMHIVDDPLKGSYLIERLTQFDL